MVEPTVCRDGPFGDPPGRMSFVSDDQSQGRQLLFKITTKRGPANCSLEAPSAVNISMWFRMWSCNALLGSILAMLALMPGCRTRRVQNRATAACTAAATSREVPPASRNCARQPARTSSLWFAADYLIRSRPVRSSSMMLMQVALARNSSSLSRTAVACVP